MTDVHNLKIMEEQTENPNDIKTKRNKTMLEQIRLENLSPNPQTSYGRTMVA